MISEWFRLKIIEALSIADITTALQPPLGTDDAPSIEYIWAAETRTVFGEVSIFVAKLNTYKVGLIVPQTVEEYNYENDLKRKIQLYDISEWKYDIFEYLNLSTALNSTEDKIANLPDYQCRLSIFTRFFTGNFSLIGSGNNNQYSRFWFSLLEAVESAAKLSMDENVKAFLVYMEKLIAIYKVN